MTTLRTIAELRRSLEPHRGASQIGLVPTMGALHDGHAALFRAARRECGVVVGTIFVNPTQFGDPADLAAYPRDLAYDEQVAAQAGTDLLFVPDVSEMYPPAFATWVGVEGPALDLEGRFRPGHFRGVATVCLKLFTIVEPDVVYFGQKDAQQVAVVKTMVRDLNLRPAIQVVPIVRDADGLALSSRNVRLTAAERQQALAIPRALEAGTAAHQNGRDPVAAARALLGSLDVEYVAIADFDGQLTLVVAARVGRTRLIDNVVLQPQPAVVGTDSSTPKEAARGGSSHTSRK